MAVDLEIDICYPKSAQNPLGDPLPTQEKFHKSDSKYRMLAGGWGTGKTTAICLELSKDIAIPNNYILLGRKDLQEFKSTTLKEFLDIYEPAIAYHNKQDRVIRFPNGAEIYYTNLDDSREAIKKIQSLNLGAAVVDQCEEISDAMFITVQGRLRRQSTRRCFYGAMNPNGHDWIWDRFINARQDNHEIFIAQTTENVFLPQDYLESLLKMPENIQRRYVYCSFDDFSGLVFNEFSESNIIDYYEPTEKDSHLIVLDYGFRNPTAIVFASTNYDGITTIYQEYYESGKLISYISEEIKKNKFWKKAHKLADPSIHKTERDGHNVADEFDAHGIYFLNADNDVLQGVNRVNELFKAGKLRITRSCLNGIKEYGNYRWKELKPGENRNEFEEPVKHNDHFCDATRYLANYIYKPIYIEKEKDSEAIARPHMLKQTGAVTDYDF
jgi:PBSX family phage terminase large subunit